MRPVIFPLHGHAYADLLGAGAARVVTCNTIPHRSNAIDIGDTIADAVLMHVDRPAGERG